MMLKANGECTTEPSSNSSSSNDESSASEEDTPAEQGDMLMVRRLLGHFVKEGEDSQRENIFHSRCSVQGKICPFIIDGGSCANIANATMVAKLGLTLLPHPKPYRLQWLNEASELKVDKQVEVEISVGKYKDNVLCDVVPMEATHLLFGRPWLYDHDVAHDSRANTYSFVHNNFKIKLVPLSPSEVRKDQERIKVSVKEFERKQKSAEKENEQSVKNREENESLISRGKKRRGEESTLSLLLQRVSLSDYETNIDDLLSFDVSSLQESNEVLSKELIPNFFSPTYHEADLFKQKAKNTLSLNGDYEISPWMKIQKGWNSELKKDKYNVTNIFNVLDLSLFLAVDDDGSTNSWTNSLQEGEHDAGASEAQVEPIDEPGPSWPKRPITRSMTKIANTLYIQSTCAATLSIIIPEEPVRFCLFSLPGRAFNAPLPGHALNAPPCHITNFAWKQAKWLQHDFYTFSLPRCALNAESRAAINTRERNVPHAQWQLCAICEVVIINIGRCIMDWTVIAVRNLQCLVVTNFGYIREYYDLFTFCNFPFTNLIECFSCAVGTLKRGASHACTKLKFFKRAFIIFGFFSYLKCAAIAFSLKLLSPSIKTKLSQGQQVHFSFASIHLMWELHFENYLNAKLFNLKSQICFILNLTCKFSDLFSFFDADFVYPRDAPRQGLYFTHMLNCGVKELKKEIKPTVEEFLKHFPSDLCHIEAIGERIRSVIRTKSKLQLPCAKCEKLPIQLNQRKLISIVGKLNKKSRQMELQILLSSLLICTPKASHFTINRGLPTPSKTQQI